MRITSLDLFVKKTEYYVNIVKNKKEDVTIIFDDGTKFKLELTKVE